MRTREMRCLEYQKYIIENQDCRQMWDKWSFLIMDVGTKIYSNLEYVDALNNSSYGISKNDSGFDFWIYSHKLSDILPPERIKFDLLNEIDSTLKLLNFNREKINYLERFQYEIIAIYMTYNPFLRTNSYYGKGIDKTSAGYKAELVRCSTDENRLKFNLHEFYQYLLKFLLEISLVEEYIIEKLIGLEDAQIVPNDFYTLLDNVEIKEAEFEEVPLNFEHFSEISLFMDYTKEKLFTSENVLLLTPESSDELDLNEEVIEEEITLELIYKELEFDTHRLVLMHKVGEFVPFFKENYNKLKKKEWDFLVANKIFIVHKISSFRPSLAKLVSEWDKFPRTPMYKRVVTKPAKNAIDKIILKYPSFFENMQLNDIE